MSGNVTGAGATRASWIDDVRSRGVAHVAAALGLTVADRASSHAVSPCPACGANRRHPSRRDKRGAIGITRDGGGWRCHECDVGGDAVSLAALVAIGCVPGRGDARWRDVRAVCAAAALCSDVGGAHRTVGSVRPPPRRQDRHEQPPRRPPADEVLAVWDASARATDDASAVSWFRSRNIDAVEVEDRDLARVIAAGAVLPAWASCGRLSWAEKHRLIVPMYDHTGQIASLHARALDDTTTPKTASPTGYEVRGLVMADPWARLMLAAQPLRNGSPSAERVVTCGVWVAEGVPDYLTVATEWSGETAPAVLGVMSGSWTEAVAGRVPDGAAVVIATDHDRAGNRYAAGIAATFRDRTVRLKRWRPPQERAP